MAFVPAVDCAEAVIHYTTPGGKAVNVLNFKHDGGYDQGNIDDLALAVDTKVGINFLALMGSAYHYDETVVRGLASIVDLEGTNDDSAGNGTYTGTTLPTSVSLAISLRTGFTGRSARGRMFVAGITADSMASADTVNSTYADAWIAALNAVQAEAAISNWDLVVISRQSGGVRLTSAVARVVTDVLCVDHVIDSQRRRLLGRGI